ncbi:hypothetical protein G7Y89_g2339 [Cudoniella acicularis]|uniref:Uncharacterized protein n=1 Tax=Cudoniella acicularis TaxID=354080 RepID=A0A8H4W731_9HELO|nr:hypothetical protein G7Y89_g2339 [Cudoniella acicularis]
MSMTIPSITNIERHAETSGEGSKKARRSPSAPGNKSTNAQKALTNASVAAVGMRPAILPPGNTVERLHLAGPSSGAILWAIVPNQGSQSPALLQPLPMIHYLGSYLYFSTKIESLRSAYLAAASNTHSFSTFHSKLMELINEPILPSRSTKGTLSNATILQNQWETNPSKV